MARVARAATRVSALGDSITAGSPYWDPDPRVRETIGAAIDQQHQWPYWAEQSHPNAQVRNYGVNRERTDEIAGRVDVALVDCDVLVVQGGINDIVQGRPADETIESLRGLIAYAKEKGIRVAVANVLPWNNGFPDKDQVIRALNARIAELALSQSVPLLDFYATLEDSERPGLMRDSWTSDGNHPSLEGHRRLGELAFHLP
jgi:lysophospholipase L1-like esterase